MRKTLWTLFLALLLVCCAAAAMADVSFQLTEHEVTVDKGKSHQLAWTVEGLEDGAKVTVTWSSDSKKTASVAKGKVTGAAGGQAVITASAALPDGTVLTDTCTVNVRVPLKSLKITTKAGTVVPKDVPVKLAYTLSPKTTTETGLVWTSSDPSVATVDENGTVKAVAPGKVTITAASASDSAVAAKVELVVPVIAAEQTAYTLTSEMPFTIRIHSFANSLTLSGISEKDPAVKARLSVERGSFILTVWPLKASGSEKLVLTDDNDPDNTCTLTVTAKAKLSCKNLRKQYAPYLEHGNLGWGIGIDGCYVCIEVGENGVADITFQATRLEESFPFARIEIDGKGWTLPLINDDGILTCQLGAKHGSDIIRAMAACTMFRLEMVRADGSVEYDYHTRGFSMCALMVKDGLMDHLNPYLPVMNGIQTYDVEPETYEARWLGINLSLPWSVEKDTLNCFGNDKRILVFQSFNDSGRQDILNLLDMELTGETEELDGITVETLNEYYTNVRSFAVKNVNGCWAGSYYVKYCDLQTMIDFGVTEPTDEEMGAVARALYGDERDCEWDAMCLTLAGGGYCELTRVASAGEVSPYAGKELEPMIQEWYGDGKLQSISAMTLGGLPALRFTYKYDGDLVPCVWFRAGDSWYGLAMPNPSGRTAAQCTAVFDTIVSGVSVIR